jgi:hypothetical protein
MMQLCQSALAVLVALFVLPAHVPASVRDPAPLVKLDVYMETLCPASARFVKEQLPLLFLNNISSIMDMSIVPWVRDQSSAP